MSLQQLITDYGYLAILIGTFLEGETILILGGFASHRGYLELPWVVVSAFIGTLAGDQFYFYLGRKHGQNWLNKRPAWKAKSGKVYALLDRHQLWLILGFRFLYGLRTITPFIVGTSRISPIRFLFLNGLGAGLWAIVIGVSGYLFGQALELLIGDIRHYEMWLFGLLAGIGLLVWWINAIRRKSPRN